MRDIIEFQINFSSILYFLCPEWTVGSYKTEIQSLFTVKDFCEQTLYKNYMGWRFIKSKPL
jgi:hypothetical protein